ncbi:ketol-acid reductoisomerase [Buchnera aphidicola]|uniref:Ketol-acid reductoisomerase n=1 Tax=Buchnera aphidicola subsp. Tuberolachnus salignus TaxID=98804 RepID=A0A160SZ78_BUCTT|nr:ketol-acid reductoisomerase [Buchnera aphidicola]CUR53361.1 Ketol-acid reductoisomerase [Buchnera aphidicola (Tuberolachnus salignus)]
MKNYFNLLNFREKLQELQTCHIIKNLTINSLKILKNKKIVIIGCGSQGYHQGLNLRDSGLDVSYAFRQSSIQKQTRSWKNAKKSNFFVGTFEELIPNADLVINLTPDKNHAIVVKSLQNLMKKNSFLGYSHGFHIVESNVVIRSDITVIMVAPKCPGTEVRAEFLKGFGVPSLIAVHQKNDIYQKGLNIAKAWAVGLGSHKAGVLRSSFSAEVKSDLMGEQTILCGFLQTCSLACYEHLISKGYDVKYSISLIQYGWEKLSEVLKIGGITLLFHRLSNSAQIRAYQLSQKLKKILYPLFSAHMDNILSGIFSRDLIKDWENNDHNLLLWRDMYKKEDFEIANNVPVDLLKENEYFEKCTLMVAMLKAGIELSFEIMVSSGILEESAYFESLHELPLIANTIARKRLYEMNQVISDTAEYGNYLFTNSALPIVKNFLKTIENSDLGESIYTMSINNKKLNFLHSNIENHPIEKIGKKLRSYMYSMKKKYN